MPGLDLNPHLLILIVGITYVIVFGITAILKQEGVSTQFMLEALIITLLVAGGGYLTQSEVNPILFVFTLYLLTMRSRLLVDLAGLLSGRGRQRDAIRLLQVALQLWPDKPSRLIVLVNMGIVQLQRENPSSAQSLLEMALEESKTGGLGRRHEAAAHYNLGVAMQQQGQQNKAVQHFHAAIKALPNSSFSNAAEKALEKRRRDQ
jgi:tetratricopeptide (TPR) repeat protein